MSKSVTTSKFAYLTDLDVIIKILPKSKVREMKHQLEAHKRTYGYFPLIHFISVDSPDLLIMINDPEGFYNALCLEQK